MTDNPHETTSDAQAGGDGDVPATATDAPLQTERADQAADRRDTASQQASGQDGRSPPGTESKTDLDPWEIHDAVMNSANETRSAELTFEVERGGTVQTGTLQCTLHMPDWGKYQAVVGALPDELIEWMEEVAEEYGNERDFEEVIEDEDVDMPRIIWDEKCVEQFRRILDGNLEHTPPEGQDKLTETPFRDLIYSLNPNRSLAGLAFAAIEMASNRDGVSQFRVE